MARSICCKPDCHKIVNARGLCNTHYYQLYRASRHLDVPIGHPRRQEDECVNGHERVGNTVTRRNGTLLCTACRLERQRSRRAELKGQVFSHYGAFCRCCGETERTFLTIDHVHGGGSQERKKMRAAETLCRKIINGGFPDTYQILCFNCNSGRWLNGGICPHEMTTKAVVREASVVVSGG